MRWMLPIFLIFILLSGRSAFAGNEIFGIDSESAAAAAAVEANNNPTLVVKAPITEDREAIISATEYSDASPQKIKQLLTDTQVKDANILLSTDQEEVVQAVVEATSSPQDKRLLRFIPIGKLAAAREKMAAGFSRYYQGVKHTFLHDRIGLTVLAITVGNDSLIWVHSASLDIHQKTAMVLMNLVMAATFSLDRDLWGNMSRPIKAKLINVFDRFIPKGNGEMFKTLSSQYLSNMFIGLGIQVVRTGLLSLDHINTVITTGSFWLTAMKLSALVTLTTFGWSELYSSADLHREPVAKMMLKRLGEIRGIIMCNLATVSMVLQPHIYGNMPIYSYIIHGAVGIIALTYAHRIIGWLETNTVIRRMYKKVQTFENFINAGFDTLKRQQQGAGAVRSCRSLFAEI
ncbi:MAG: hypothetical protein ACXWQQ_04450 [Pseudobdellovibrio sp.]